ncbi:MAG: lipid-A-disaccharide synthase [Bdellovibrionota bacterium]
MKIAISAGETSGDEHGAKLALALKDLSPQAELIGMGGRNMRAAGVATFIDSEESASVMGFKDVILSLGKIFKTLNQFKQELSKHKPDLLILIDYPDFNLSIAKHAHNLGIRTVYFIPPKLWAWRSSRVEKIKKHIDCMACIFPFEPAFYQSKAYDKAQFVGHPFTSCNDFTEPSQEERERFLRTLNLNPVKPVLTIFPGSRKREVIDHLNLLLEAVRIASKSQPEIQTIVTAAPNISNELLNRFQSTDAKFSIYRGDSIETLRMADAGIIKSGTSNLQAAFTGLPFAMFYKMGAFSEIVANLLVPLDEYSIVNIIRPKSIRELIKHESHPESVAQEILKLLFNDQYRTSLKKSLQQVVNSLKTDAAGNAYAKTAAFFLNN